MYIQTYIVGMLYCRSNKFGKVNLGRGLKHLRFSKHFAFYISNSPYLDIVLPGPGPVIQNVHTLDECYYR